MRFLIFLIYVIIELWNPVDPFRYLVLVIIQIENRINGFVITDLFREKPYPE